MAYILQWLLRKTEGGVMARRGAVVPPTPVPQRLITLGLGILDPFSGGARKIP
jgi:hypothetical protein